MKDLSEQEAAVYDRQLRVWGVETQKRLSTSKVLIIGCTGLAAETAKNVVLAGVGSVTMIDDTPCSLKSSGNFLIPADVEATQTVSAACVAQLQEMNPFVQISCLKGPIRDALTKELFGQFNLVLLCGQSAQDIQKADVLCSEMDVHFYAASCRGISGWIFANLHQHEYTIEILQRQPNGELSKITQKQAATYASWSATMKADIKGRSIRQINKLYPVLRACSEYEASNGRPVKAEDLQRLQQICVQDCQNQGLDSEFTNMQLLQAYVSHQEEMPAINAVVGGILANDILKSISHKGEPIHNLFMYSLCDGVGAVECYGR